MNRAFNIAATMLSASYLAYLGGGLLWQIAQNSHLVNHPLLATPLMATMTCLGVAGALAVVVGTLEQTTGKKIKTISDNDVTGIKTGAFRLSSYATGTLFGIAAYTASKGNTELAQNLIHEALLLPGVEAGFRWTEIAITGGKLCGNKKQAPK